MVLQLAIAVFELQPVESSVGKVGIPRSVFTVTVLSPTEVRVICIRPSVPVGTGVTLIVAELPGVAMTLLGLKFVVEPSRRCAETVT